MDDRNGRLYNADKLDAMLASDKAHMVQVKRDLTERERSEMQIKLYSPCACGSGKKFKFCCKK